MKTIAFILLAALWPHLSQAQYLSTALPFLTVSRGPESFGLGNQGVTLQGGLSGMQYNPATLFSLKNPIAEYGKLDQFITPLLYPLSWYRVGMKVENVGVFGLEFTYFDLGEFARTGIDPTVIETFHGYQWALALSYATDLGEDVAIGATVRNAYSRLAAFGTAQGSGSGTTNALLFGAGLLYHATEWGDRFTAGFSLTDFGAPVTYTDPQQADPAPAYMRLGISVVPIVTRGQRLTLAFEGTRQVVDVNNDYTARSSFAALFSSFKRWPHDIVGRGGALYEFPQIPLTRDVDLSGKIGVGAFDEPYDGGFNYLTSSFELGLRLFDFDLSFSVASVWNHIEPNPPLLTWWGGKTIPEEALGVTVSYRPRNSEFLMDNARGKTTIVVGAGISSPIGRFRDPGLGNGPAFSVECANFTTDETAVVLSLGYQSNDAAGFIGHFDPDGTWKTWRAALEYRFAPNASPIPVYVQAGPVISRIGYAGRPEVTLQPSYLYNFGFTVGTGIPVGVGPVIIVPSVDFVSMLFGQFTGPPPG